MTAIPDKDRSAAYRARQSEKVARMKAALERIGEWLESVSGCDPDDIVADGGITAGMVIVKEAGLQLKRAQEALGLAPTDGRGEG